MIKVNAFKPFTLAEVQKLADQGRDKGSRGKKTKLTGNYVVNFGGAGSRGEGR